MALRIENVTMTGSEITYLIAQDVSAIGLRANGADIAVRTTATTGGTFTIADGDSYTYANKGMRGQSIYLTGASGKMELWIETGMMS
jgi:hypothetical protein